MRRESFKIPVIISFVAMIALPFIGGYFKWPNHLPPIFGTFPQTEVPPPLKPEFSLLYFLLGLAVCLLISAVYLFPRLFGFKPSQGNESNISGKFPYWFLPGLLKLTK